MEDFMNDQLILEKAKKLCHEENGRLLYLSRFGSHLYGTNTLSSDIDYKGVFLPDISVLLMGKKCKAIGFQSKDDPSLKNTSNDVDLQIFPIQFWLNKLVRKGETEGIELLYSHTNRDAIIYCDQIMETVFLNKGVLFDPRNTQGFLGFAISQARTYFTKAERFSVIRDVYNFLRELKENNNYSFFEMKLLDIIDDILSKYAHQTYCFSTDSNGIRSIQLCGKVHQETIELREFFDRVEREFNKYGHRTKTAAELDNKDWKSLSHALKAVIEVKMLLTDLKICFPLHEKYRNLLRDIKVGIVPFEDVEKLILEGIDEVDYLKDQFSLEYLKYDEEKVKSIISNMYGMII